MRAGLLTEHLKFFSEQTTPSLTGALKKDWKEVYSCRAYKRKAPAGREVLNAKEVFNSYSLVFQVRFNPSIDDNQRVEYRGKMYKIIPPLDYQPTDNTYILTINRIDE